MAWAWNGTGSADDPYQISSTADWNTLADNVNNQNQTYSGKFFKLMNDITVTETISSGTPATMVGTSDSNSFQGTFDGNGHTITLNYNDTRSGDFCAPFRYINGATIKYLHMAGTIYKTKGKNAGGLVGKAVGDNTIDNCRSSVDIHFTKDGDVSSGGFIGELRESGSTTFNNCLFDGKLRGADANKWGGFVGWVASGRTATFNNCLFNPEEIDVDTDGCKTFARITVYVRNTPVTNVAATGITPNTATISWTGSEGCSNYQVRYRVKPDNTLYSTDFEGGNPADWTTFNNDNDEYNWEYSDGTKKGMSHSGDGCMYSASYINNYGALNPDNWLVSPQLTLGGTMKVWLKGQDADEYREHFAIYLSTTGNSSVSDFTTVLVPETETTSIYQEYTADLSTYSGKGYIAIRHFNCEDEFYLVLDDFGLYDENAGGAWTTVSNASPAGTTLTGLTADTTYEYQVVFQYGGKTFNTSTATLTTLNDNIAPFDLSATALSANTATLSWTGYGDSYNLRYSQGGTAKVTLSVPNDIWEDGTGYQMLLDKDHNTYGSVIPTEGGLTGSGDASPETYAYFEYKIPENADGYLNTSNVVKGTDVTEVTITILAGTYDWCITNPSPGDRVWIASENGNVGGRQDDFVFEAGKHYTFTVTLDQNSGNDCTNMTVEDDAALTQGNVTNVTGITSTSYTLSGLTATTGYVVYVQSVKGEKTSEWSSVLFTTLNEGEMALYVPAATVWESDNPNTPVNGWTFIASPVTTDIVPDSVSGLVATNASDYDLYQLNNTTWENYKATTSENHPGFTTLVNGYGYLYASKEETTLLFTGDFNNDNNMTVNLKEGWNLVGNPFTVAAYVNRSFYTMNAKGTGLIPNAITDYQHTTIAPCTGIVVQAASTNEHITFSTTAPTQQSVGGNNGNLNIALTQTNTRSTSTALDNIILSFNEGSELGKFYFGHQNANISIPQNGEEYAIAYAGRDGVHTVSTMTEVPVNFKANENGIYTLTVSGTLNSSLLTPNFHYLHLLDNLTGADIDLLQTPSYTFEGKTTDYAARFKLVFVANDAQLGGEGNDDFAFIHNGELIVLGEGTVQVIDMLGHVLVTRDAHSDFCLPTSDFPAGVYVLRLVNGDDVKTQKIVVR